MEFQFGAEVHEDTYWEDDRVVMTDRTGRTSIKMVDQVKSVWSPALWSPGAH
jgi:hypothetical protein